MRYHPVKIRLSLIWLCAKFPHVTPVIAWLYRFFQSLKGSGYILPPFGVKQTDEQIHAKTSSGDVDELDWKIFERPSGAERSVIFTSHSYYHFYYLAAALRERGWHAISVNLEDPSEKNPNNLYYHGEDINLWSDDNEQRKANIHKLFDAIVENFDMVHFHGEEVMSLFHENNQNLERDVIPWEFLELKRRGVKVGFSISGCLTGQPQTLFNQISGGVCGKCVWQHNPSVCNDSSNASAGKRLEWMCDLIACEGDWITSYRDVPQAYREPLTYCVNTDIWKPGLPIPDHYKIDRDKDEILVLHSVGNYDERSRETRNIKGTPFVMDAVERLKKLGYPIRLIFKTGIPSRDMRFIQSQADLVVDQLNYGRFGATARECLALGKPVITNCNPLQRDGSSLKSLTEAPVIHASEETIFETLQSLCDKKESWKSISKRSRNYALNWFCANQCAKRFEGVYDQVMRRERVNIM